jgi:hypothetical protein
MTADQYRAALAKLGLSQEGAAFPLGIGKRTSQGYALGEYPVHQNVAVLLRLLLTGKITIKDVEAARKERKAL